MPYQGVTLSILEMVSVLIEQGHTEEAAVAALAHAFEDKAIPLLLPAGVNEHDEPLFSEITNGQRSAVVLKLREFSSRAQVPTIRQWNAPAKLMEAIRSPRVIFEIACRLTSDEPLAPANRRSVKDESLVEKGVTGVRVGRWPNAHKAAQDLARDADGASYPSSVQRLEQKIRAKLRKSMN